jgi:tetratricopeptide (TPR) repeat protein
LATMGERLWRQSPVEYDALLVQHLDLLLAAGKKNQGDDDWQNHAMAFVTLVVMEPNDETTTSVVLESSASSSPLVDPLLLRQRACLAVPVLEWRRPGSFASSTILYRARDFLHAQYLAARAAAAKSMTARPKTDANLQTMRSAVNAIAAWLVFRGEEEDRGVHGTDGPISLSPACAYADECGVAYLELLAAWNGLHRPPWSHTGSAEARIIIQRARQSAHAAADPIDATLLLQLSEADAEGGAVLDIGGGARLETARRLYERTRQEAVVSATVTTTDQQQQSGRPMLMKLVQARCLLGQALLNETHEDRWSDATAMIQESITCLGSINVGFNDGVEVVETALHLWTRPNMLTSSIVFWTCQARQIHARILLRRGQAVEAQAVLENAVKDSPNDASASLGLGSFRLYKALFVDAADGDDATNAGSTGELKAAQVQLLKAAKLDSSQADPFALLGYWYEYMGDVKRAAGCYSKALLLHPAQPVAGRGLIRLAPSSVLQSTFDSAVRTASTSSTNGWAWRAIGEHKAMVDGEDELAVVALLKALRCQDIVREKSDLQAPFYKDPKVLKSRATLPEQAATLWALAQCYRRLGRFTASIRTFNVAIEIGGEVLSSDLLRDCAQGTFCFCEHRLAHLYIMN